MIGLCCAVSLAERDAEVTLLERAAVGSGASAGNAGWVVPSLATPLGAPGMLRTGIRSALDPRGALVIRPALDTSWIRWLWQFRRSCSPERYTAGVRALLTLTRRTLGVLDAYAAAGVAFEEHRTGILAVARSPAGLAWFATLHEELAALGIAGGARATLARRCANARAGAGAGRRGRDARQCRPARRAGIAHRRPRCAPSRPRRDHRRELRRACSPAHGRGLDRDGGRHRAQMRCRCRRDGRSRQRVAATTRRPASARRCEGILGHPAGPGNGAESRRLPVRAEARPEPVRRRAADRRLLRAAGPHDRAEPAIGSSSCSTIRSATSPTGFPTARRTPAGPGSGLRRPTACRSSARSTGWTGSSSPPGTGCWASHSRLPRAMPSPR